MEKSLCIVLRTADYRDNDKMLTLFSREAGKIDALSRGCKKGTSSLLACSQIFTCGMYSYYIRHGKYYISQCEITDSFYGLREDVERFSAAAYIVEAAEKIINHDESNERLFALVANCLYALKTEAVNLHVLIFFMVKYADIAGYRPNIYSCVICGKKTMKTGNNFSCREGGIVCAGCSKTLKNIKPVTSDAICAIHEIITLPAKSVLFFKKEKSVLYELYEIFLVFIEDKLEKRLTSAEFLKRIIAKRGD